MLARVYKTDLHDKKKVKVLILREWHVTVQLD